MTATTIDAGQGSAPAATGSAATSTEQSPTRSAKDWARLLAPCRQPRQRRALFELVVTLLPFAGLWLAMLWNLAVGYWLTLLIALPTAGFLVRLFMIQHDCGHGSFFPRRWANDGLGRVLGVLTLTPYGHWRRNHAAHHATSGNLDRRAADRPAGAGG